MNTLLTNIHTLLPMTGRWDASPTMLHDAALLIRDHEILWIGPSDETQPLTEFITRRGLVDEVISLRDHIVLPGLVNTHHHLYQTLTRCMAQDSGLFRWLKTLYPIWLRLTAEAIHSSAQVGLAELMLSGCTTASDHLYLFPNDCCIDDEVRAAQEIGIRFHATRGSMSLGESKGGLPPDRAVEPEAVILRDSERVIRQFHQPTRFAMTRIALAPCSPFSISPGLMRDTAALARTHGIGLHTHLAETREEDEYCRHTFGLRPLDYAESVHWLGRDVWFAHGVYLSEDDLTRMGACGCGVAHCPSSNMRLASGIAPARAMLEAGVRLGLGVDGSASNDGNHMLLEARQAMLLQRINDDSFAQQDGVSARAPRRILGAYQALWIATRGGASILDRDDIGQLAVGLAADLIAINLNRAEFAGALHDPLAALLFCAPRGVDFSMIHGRVVIRNTQLQTLELAPVLARHNAISRAMINGV